MKLSALIFTIILVINCSTKQPDVAEPNINTNAALPTQNTPQANKPPLNEKPLERVQNSTDKVKLPEVKDFIITHLRRISENKPSDSSQPSFFDYAETDTQNHYEVKVGEKYTVVPLDADIQPFQLPINKATKIKNSECGEKEPDFIWAIEFERINNKEILEIQTVKKNSSDEYPFDVFLIYPAVEFAKQVPQNQLTEVMIPDKIALQTVKGAIDLDNDGKPDLLQASYCCTETNVSPEEDGDCYACVKTFKKEKGIWKLIVEAMPC